MDYKYSAMGGPTYFNVLYQALLSKFPLSSDAWTPDIKTDSPVTSIRNDNDVNQYKLQENVNKLPMSMFLRRL